MLSVKATHIVWVFPGIEDGQGEMGGWDNRAEVQRSRGQIQWRGVGGYRQSFGTVDSKEVGGHIQLSSSRIGSASGCSAFFKECVRVGMAEDLL